MGYVGNQTTNRYSSMDKQVITGNGGASYTLTHAVANAQEIEVFVNNVRQEAGVAYTVAGTALSMTGNVASTDDFYVIYQGKALQTVVPPDGSVTNAKITTMAASKLTGALPAIDGSALTGIGGGTGSIVQVQYTMFTGTSTTAYTSSSNKKLTDLAVNITPTSTNSIIKLEAFVTGEFSNTNAIYNTGWFFYRDNTALVAPNAGSRTAGIQIGTNISYFAADASSTPENANYMYFDSPSSTSQITYSVGFNSYYAGNWHLNRTNNDTNAVDFERGISSICVTEIAG